MTTLMGSPSAWIFCASSMPVMPGISISVTTMSGRRRRHSDSACMPSAAAPSTSMSRSSLSSAPSAPRTIAWSSASSMRITWFPSRRDGNRGAQQRAALLVGAEREAAADIGEALAHAVQAIAHDDAPALPVVGHFDDHGVLFLLHANGHAGGGRVPADVGGRLAQAERERSLPIVRQLHVFGLAFHLESLRFEQGGGRYELGIERGAANAGDGI